jgi:hypothetical protein
LNFKEIFEAWIDGRHFTVIININYVDGIRAEEGFSCFRTQNSYFDVLLELRLVLLQHLIVEDPHELLFVFLFSELNVAVPILIN